MEDKSRKQRDDDSPVPETALPRKNGILISVPGDTGMNEAESGKGGRILGYVRIPSDRGGAGETLPRKQIKRGESGAFSFSRAK